MMGSNWEDLPNDVVEFTLNKLTLLPDYIRFGAVCKQWRSVALIQKQKRMKTCQEQPPMLLIPEELGSKEDHNLYSPCEDKVYNCHLRIPYSFRCCGTSYGWWAFAERDLSITLVNPFHGKTIHLPPVMEIPFYEGYENQPQPPYWPEYLIRKVILSCDPCLYPNDYVVVAVHDEDLPRIGFIRPGDQSWSYPYAKFPGVKDVQFYKGKLYAIDGYSRLVAVDYSFNNGTSDDDDDDDDDEEDNNEDDAEDEGAEDEHYWVAAAPMEYLVKRVKANVHWTEWSMVSYLVESLDGELLLIRRLYLPREEEDKNHEDAYDDYDYKVTVGFKVYKLAMKNQEKELDWIEIQSLGNSTLFLGENDSVCISAARFPNCCKPNCIYYTDGSADRFDDKPYEATDMGVFHLDNGQIEKLYDLPQSVRRMPPPAWICPTLIASN